MAKVLLINPSYVTTYSGHKASIASPLFPVLGLSAIAATAMQHGHQVSVLDLCYLPYDPQTIRQHILNEKPDIVGITATTPGMNQLRDISVLIKDIAPEIRVVGGGPHPASMPRETLLESMLDVVFIGEADYSFAEYCDGIPLKDIKGIFYRDGDQIVSTGTRPPIANLDDLPMPAWELFDAEVYRKHASRIYVRKAPQASVEFSRGCVFKCDYCASKMTMALGYRKKSPQRCAEEIRKLYSLGFRELLVVDDIFTSDQEWAAKVCDAIIEANTGMIWTCSNGIRVESSNVDLFRKMKKAGCYRVAFGFESGNDEILKAFGKGGKASVAQGREAVKQAREANIDTQGSFMLGLTADTEATMMDTINYARELPLDMIRFANTIGFPGTEMFNRYHAKGMVASYDWDDYSFYSSKSLFTHAELTEEVMDKYMALAYTKTIWLNPAFVLRRLWRGIKTGDIFWDAYYAIKFAFLPAVSNRSASNYYARDRWPVYDYQGQALSRTDYQIARKPVADNQSIVNNEYIASSKYIANNKSLADNKSNADTVY